MKKKITIDCMLDELVEQAGPSSLHRVARKYSLTDEVIDKYLELWDWKILTEHQIEEYKRMRRYQDRIDWSVLTRKLWGGKNHRYLFCSEFVPFLDWTYISGMCLSEGFARTYRQYLNWPIYLDSNSTISEEFINEMAGGFGIEEWRWVSNRSLSFQFLRKHRQHIMWYGIVSKMRRRPYDVLEFARMFGEDLWREWKRHGGLLWIVLEDHLPLDMTGNDLTELKRIKNEIWARLRSRESFSHLYT